MSEYFLKLDPNNYNSELEYLLDSDTYTFQDYQEFYCEGLLNNKEWEKVKDYYETYS